MAQQNTSINGSTGVNHDGWTPEDTLEIREIIEFFKKYEIANSIFVWMIGAIEIPVMILTLFALCVLIKSDRSASVFVIHLILSDLIQIISMMTSVWRPVLSISHLYCLIVGLYLMACVAFERYLLVCHPIWYKSHHSLKVPCVISVIIWFVPLIFASIVFYSLNRYLISVSQMTVCLIPYLIIILCFVGTSRGLSRSISLTSLKRKLILGSLSLVLLTYTFIILPFMILNFIVGISPELLDSLLFFKLLMFFKNFLYLNPLADCILYLFMRSDVGDLMKPVHCCCRTDRHQNSRQSRDEHTMEMRVTSGCNPE